MKIQKSDLNASIRDIVVPPNMLELPVSRKGFPVPFFVARFTAPDWDFRILEPGRVAECFYKHLCWVCGQKMGSKNAYVSGPMCVMTGTTAEPPSHLSCAQYAAIACPFLANPQMKRNEKGLHEDVWQPGYAIMRNPGVAAVLITRAKPRPFDDGRGNALLEMGEPDEVEWYANRRRATYDEVSDSISSGVERLLAMYDEEPDLQKRSASREQAALELAEQMGTRLKWLPAKPPLTTRMIGKEADVLIVDDASGGGSGR